LRNLLTQRLEEFASLFQALEFSPDAVFVTDRHDTVVFWNDAARLLLGYNEDEVLGASGTDLLHGCDQFGNRYCSENCPIMQMANRSEIVRPFTLRLHTKDHRKVLLEVTIVQLRASASGEYLIAHLLRSTEEETPHAPAEPAEPPRPRLVVARESPDVRARKLTSREVEVLGMLAAGRTTPEIADRLHISQLTARSHIQHLLEKLEVHSKAEAVAFAFQKNLI
jgi:PAS domain S-box-containing protein